MITRQTFYSFDPADDDFPSGGTVVHYYYHQPAHNVAIYHIMTLWYKILDIPFISKRVCKNAKQKSQLPRDCGLVHDHAAEPTECWWICPCTDRDLRIWNYREKNAVPVKDDD
jgi:hypothetical protein